jgi:hypothetical protein
MSDGSIFYCNRCMDKDRSGEQELVRTASFLFANCGSLTVARFSLSGLCMGDEILISVYKKCLLPCLLRVEGV